MGKFYTVGAIRFVLLQRNPSEKEKNFFLYLGSMLHH
jgi:hypothetical protein